MDDQPDHRARIAERVVRSLDETRDSGSLVHDYFDADRDVLIEATRQTLEATREDASEARIADTLERELIDALRYPEPRRRGLLPWLYLRRGRVAGAAVLVAAVIGVLLLAL